jgi:hypothetical protein
MAACFAGTAAWLNEWLHVLRVLLLHCREIGHMFSLHCCWTALH